MPKNLKWIILLTFLVIFLGTFYFPVPHKSFEELSSNVDPDTTASLLAFRQEHSIQQVEVDGVIWEYISFGQGDDTILFLHGMTGAADIWWQQMIALSDRYRVISTTYPPVDSLEAMSQGVLAILEQEEVATVNVVGSSLGGYFTQNLVVACQA